MCVFFFFFFKLIFYDIKCVCVCVCFLFVYVGCVDIERTKNIRIDELKTEIARLQSALSMCEVTNILAIQKLAEVGVFFLIYLFIFIVMFL